MKIKGLFLSWLLSSLIMFSMSYLWHGIFLNDFERLSYPKEIFLTGSIITYLILGFLVTKIFLMPFPKPIAKEPLLRGLIAGSFLGCAVYIVALVIGISFNSTLTTKYILFDLLWQTFEQACGGITVAMVYIAILHNGNPLEIVFRKLFGD